MRIAVYTHLWLACIALLLTWECSVLFPAIQQSFHTALFAASATLFVYNAHTLAMRYIKGVKNELSVWSRKNNLLVWLMCLMGFVVSVYILLAGFTYDQYILLTVIILLCSVYEWNVIWSKRRNVGLLHKLPFFKSMLLALVWVSVTSVLPLSEKGFEWIHNFHCMLFIGIRFLTCLLIVILFDCRDVTSDRETSVKTIPNVWGMTVTAYICYAIALVIILLLLFVEVHSYFVIVRVVQITLLLFFLRARNSTSFGASMLLWDGVLIISPLTGLLLFSI